ncbi:alginate biosynthesis protein [Pseudoalteromonas lipolytica]|uniref:Alginate biosynthesis protein n=1 Tax=Pseudoalteromonas lipolytica TaxID=570156 RepID=A0AAD0S0K3_9GAMM|nr:histidine kinase [Pseudoalteromonas donghaensis]AXV65762.1 alginate biosynthesis protein [Pseudoalteromonas donghaensis]
MSTQPNQNGLLIAALFQSRGVLATLVVSQVIAILLAFAPATEGDVWLRLAIFSFFLHLIFLTSVAALYIFRKYLARYSNNFQLLILTISLLLSTCFYSVAVLSLFADIYYIESAGYFIASNVLIIFLVAALFSQFVVIQNQKELQTKALAHAELDALQARIRPHFLFNSLNTAAELTHYDAEAAEQAILALAALSQAAMKSGKAISLQDELILCEQYIALERWRYGERLTVNWQMPACVPDVEIPCLTIQPIIENAVYYGLEPASESTKITIEMHITDKSYTFIIINPVLENAEQRRAGNGMALENIRQRLALFYHYRAKLTTTHRDSEFRAKLVIPRQEIT